MLTHEQIWNAIDRLAQRCDLTPSALAKRAGLDPTTFNRSKRFSPDGRLRWPSTESLSKALEATHCPVDMFFMNIPAEKGLSKVGRTTLPLIGFAQAGSGGYFDDAGFPVGAGWDEVVCPSVTDESAYALEISGDSMLPLYRDGDIIIVSPASPLRRGDRVVVRTIEGEVLAKELRRKTARTIELKSLNPVYEDRVLGMQEVSWIARIVWATQ